VICETGRASFTERSRDVDEALSPRAFPVIELRTLEGELSSKVDCRTEGVDTLVSRAEKLKYELDNPPRPGVAGGVKRRRSLCGRRNGNDAVKDLGEKGGVDIGPGRP
jgi:hypothetical protein